MKREGANNNFSQELIGMTQKAKPVSKIPTTGKNTNQKKKGKKIKSLDLGGSLLKLNEFTLIVLGALVVTGLVFFLFFRSPDPGSEGAAKGVKKQNGVGQNPGLEKRIGDLEVSLARIASSSSSMIASPSSKEVAELDQRVTRLEAATTLKLDGLLERIGKMEKQITGLKHVSTVSAKPVKSSKPVVVVPQKAPIKKKAVQSKKKKNFFHTVKKGETLWSISQKHKISVTTLRKLNKMTAKDKIYPGNNILVR